MSADGDEPIRLLLVDDHEIVRMGLRMLFKRALGIRIVGEAADAAGALALAKRLKPDVVLMDLRLPDDSGVEACRAIRAALDRARVLFLTTYRDNEAMCAAVLAGADGYLLKEIDGESLLRAVRIVARGQSILDPLATQALMERMRALSGRHAPPVGELLSAQEGRVLELIADGKTNREIAAALGISDKTVKNHVSRVLQKLNVQRRTQAAADFLRRTRRGELELG